MNIAIALVLVLLGPLKGWAENSIAVKLQVAGDIAFHHHADRKGGVRCKNGHPDYGSGIPHYTVPLNFSTNQFHSESAFIKYEPHNSARYEVNVDAATQTKRGSTAYRVGVRETVITHAEYHWSTKCENNHVNEDLKSAGYDGEIQIKYEVPEGVWALVVTKNQASTVFNNESDGPFTNVLMKASEKDAEIIWVNPHTVIEKTLKINADANLNRPPVAYSIEVTPIGEILTEETAHSLLNSEAFTNMISNLNGEKKLESQLADTGKFIDGALSLLRSHGPTTAALRKLSFVRLRWLTDNLFTLTNATFEVNSPAVEMTAKAAAALVSYEVASLTVEEMAPFCEMRYAESPTTGQRVHVLGARYAQFLLESLGNHLNPSIFSAHQAFIAQLKHLQGQKISYEHVAQTGDVRRQIAQAFTVLRANASLDQRPFRQAEEDFKDYVKVFRSLQSGSESLDTLSKKLKFLADQERAYLDRLDVHVHSYHHGNSALLDVTALQDRLEEMKALAADVSTSLAGQGRFLAIGGDAEANALLNLLMGFRERNFGIVASAYADVPFKFEFENVRQSYVDQKRLSQNQRTINACVSDGTHL